MNITKALADENRVRMLLALRGRELCVCQITELFQLAPSTVSKHLSILYQAGFLEYRKDGRWIYYKTVGHEAAQPIREAMQWVYQSVAKNPQVTEDLQQLKNILKMDPVELCKRQCQK